MPRLTNDKHRSLNESISHVANPAAALAQAEEYAELLEEVVAALCEEMEIDPQELVEDAMTPGRLDQSRAKLKKLVQARKAAGPGDTPEYRKASAEYKKGRGELRSKTKVYGKGGKVLKRKPDITEDAEVVEDVMTAARMREHDKALKPLYTANRNTPAGTVNKGVDRAINASRALAAREQKSKTFIGRGGKPVKREPTAAEKRKSRDYDPR